MSWVLTLLKTIAKTLAPTAAERLLDRILPTKRPEPKVPPHPLPRDLLHIDDQIDRATQDFKVTSPRAIVPTQMRPPPRKPRRQ